MGWQHKWWHVQVVSPSQIWHCLRQLQMNNVKPTKHSVATTTDWLSLAHARAMKPLDNGWRKTWVNDMWCIHTGRQNTQRTIYLYIAKPNKQLKQSCTLTIVHKSPSPYSSKWSNTLSSKRNIRPSPQLADSCTVHFMMFWEWQPTACIAIPSHFHPHPRSWIDCQHYEHSIGQQHTCH